MTERPIRANAPFLIAVVTGTGVTAPYIDAYVYNTQGGPLELLRQRATLPVLCAPERILLQEEAPGHPLDRWP